MKKKILVSISSCLALSALSFSNVKAVAKEGPYDKEPRCFICDIAPRYVDEGKLQAFCSRPCHIEFDSNHDWCLNCGKKERYINPDSEKNLYCTAGCAREYGKG